MRKQIAWGLLLFASLLVGTTWGQSLNDQLISAVPPGDTAKAQLLIAQGADVNAKGNYRGWTVLDYAVLNNKRDIAELLIAKGADVNAKDDEGMTPLYYASEKGEKDIADLLIAKGADVNAKDKSGTSPLMEASATGNKDLAKLLLDKGADVNAQDKHGDTPLYYAASNFAEYAASHYGKTDELVKRGQVYVAEMLLSKGADVNAKSNEDGFTPLSEAISTGNPVMAELLINTGADVNAKDKGFGDTPLHDASKKGDISTAELLIARGAGVNTKNNFADTPLHYTPCNGGKDMAALLIAKGADVNAINSRYFTTLDEAASCGAKDVAELLIADHATLNDETLKKAKNGISNAQLKQEMVALLQTAMEEQSGNDIQTLSRKFKGHSENEDLRTTIIDLALKQRSSIPSEAEAAAGRGAYLFKNAKSANDTLSAAKEYLTAIEIAPWVANFYYNLCTVLEKTPYTQEALHACKLYLVAAPNAPDAGDMKQRIAGLQYAADRDKAQMKRRTAYIKPVGVDDLYRLGGISLTVSGKDIVLKLFVDWYAAPPKYQILAACLQGEDVYTSTYDLVSTDESIRMCHPGVNMHLLIKPEGEGFVEVSDASGGSIRATLDELFSAKQKTMAQSVMVSANSDSGERFYVMYDQGGKDQKHAGYLMYESDCNGSILKKDPRALPDDFVPGDTMGLGRFTPEVLDYPMRPRTDICARQFASKTGYHFGKAE